MKPTRIRYLPLVIVLIGEITYAQENNSKTMITDIEQNKETIRNLYEHVLNQRKMELLPVIISADFRGPGGTKGAAGFEEPITILIQGFPDAQWEVEELIGEGDKVAAKWRVSGTHTGTFGKIGSTGKEVSNDGMAIFTLKEGKIISARVLTDRLAFLQSLSVIPFDLGTLPVQNNSDCYVRFIDKFFVPSGGKKEFYERMNMNRTFIKTLPGFIEDVAYENLDDHGNLICITIATWENQESIDKAREAVQQEYKRQGFDPAEMMKRLNISMDRGIYRMTGH
ncbi:MAG TPA: ester cyclase [Cyclobacteriaceae bacterium]|nr:ester cyclase [Cyclobacteriaceae bacterium]